MTRTRAAIAVIAATFAIAVALSTGCARSAGPDPAANIDPRDGAALVPVLCTQCHNAMRIQAARKDRAAWIRTVTRMQTHGLKVTPLQKQSIIDYLTTRDGGS